MTQTLLAITDGKLREYPSSDKYSLKDRLFDYFCGAGPKTIVYGYILNRRSIFVDPYYGWGLPRN